MPAAELAGDHLVVSCQVRRTQGAAVYALRLDVAQKEAAHSASCPPAADARGLDWCDRPVFFYPDGECASPRQSAPLSCQCAVREACILRILPL